MAAPKHTRVALYLQDKHPIREGMAHARYAEEKGFRGGLAGGKPPGAGCDCADGRLRSGHRANSDWLRRHQQLDPQYRAVGGHLSDIG